MGKFKVGDKVKCIEKGRIKDITIGKVYIVKDLLAEDMILIRNDTNCKSMYCDYRFEKVENNMAKTFKEVIADIKEGEVWENEHKIISCNKFDIDIKNKTGEKSKFVFDNNVEYTLQRQQYNFQEAFEAYEEGKEIESCISGNKWGEEVACFNTIAIEDIKGKWYINN